MMRRAMTLVEMLVAMTATLVLMAAIAQAFAAFGSAINSSRSVLELDGRMRAVAARLRSDLSGATARTLPPRNPADGGGYFEVIEGPAIDADAGDNAVIGPADHDDALLFTATNRDSPFQGRLARSTLDASGQTSVCESPLAELAWFARETPGSTTPRTYTLYRRQMLVMGYVGSDPFDITPPATAAIGASNAIPVPTTFGPMVVTTGSVFGDFFNLPCDISVRLEKPTGSVSGFLVPNTLADLSRRECRFMHNVTGTSGAAGFPFAFVEHQTPSVDLSKTQDILPATHSGLIFDRNQRRGEDVVLTNVLAFDVRVFDPTAPVAIGMEAARVPGDPEFGNVPAVACGAYVDLGNAQLVNNLLPPPATQPRFAGYGQSRSRLLASGSTRRTYDTWSTHYEANGVDEDSSFGVDQGTNGLDDDDDGLIDEPPLDANNDGIFEDLGEAETMPPYPYPLRGIEVRIRCYEPSSRQVRQVTIRHTFVPH